MSSNLKDTVTTEYRVTSWISIELTFLERFDFYDFIFHSLPVAILLSRASHETVDGEARREFSASWHLSFKRVHSLEKGGTGESWECWG